MRAFVRSRRCVLVGSMVTLGLAGCSSDPTAPASVASPLAPASETAALPLNGADVKKQDKPHAVFRTVPGADVNDVVRGTFPLSVHFNNCQSRPGNEDDNLKFTYDFNGDGTVDEFGHCRWDHVYTDNATARVCVSDRRPENEVCQTWTILGAQPPIDSNLKSLSFTIDSINCGATQPFEFFLNGVSLGSVMSTAPCACSASANVDTYTFNSDAALSSWNNGGSNTIRFVNNGSFTAAAAVAFVNVQVARRNGTTLGACLDADGVSPCAGPSTCAPGPYLTTPIDVSTVLVDN